MRPAFLFLLAAALAAPSASAANMIVGATSLQFATTQGGANPPAQSFYAYPDTTGTTFNPTVTATTSNGGNWLTLSFANGSSMTTTLQVIVNVNSQGLAVGTYTGEVTLVQSNLGGSPATVAISLQVFASGTVNYIATPTVIEANAAVGANAASQTLQIITIGSATVKPQVTATTASGGSWLALSAVTSYTFNTTSTVQVNFSTAGLAAGFYTGTITAVGAGVANSPFTIPVNLQIGTPPSGPKLTVAPPAIGFTAAVGINPAPAMLSVGNGGQGTIAPTLTTVTATGGAWLGVTWTPSGGTSGGGVVATVTANVAGLAAGSYSGTVIVTDGGASNSPLLVPVTLTIQAGAPVLALSGTSIGLAAATGATATGTVMVTNTGTGVLNFSATPTTVSGGLWLTVSPTTGTAPATLTITANATGLATGVYTGNVAVAVTNASTGANSPQNITVTLAVGVPAINANGIVNGANFTSLSVSPGEIVTAFGVGMGPSPGQNTTAPGGQLQTSSNGTSVTIGGIPAPLYFVSATQVNMQVPFEMQGKSSAAVVLTYNNGQSPTYTLPLRTADPGIFISNGRMAILNVAGSQITPSNPAHVGDYVSIFATGLGTVQAQCTGTGCTAITIQTGQLAPTTPLFNTQGTVTVTIGGQPANVTFSGLAPLFAGLYQVNVQVPAGTAAGDQPLVLQIATSSGTVVTQPLPLAVH